MTRYENADIGHAVAPDGAVKSRVVVTPGTIGTPPFSITANNTLSELGLMIAPVTVFFKLEYESPNMFAYSLKSIK
jgi:hypothetical protein